MITMEDAQRIVERSVGKITNRSLSGSGDTLSDLGIHSPTYFNDLVQTIVSDPDNGAPSLWAKVESQHLVTLSTIVTIGALVDALHLSATKLCSNPTSPHPQPCCPYPKTCGTCGSAVL